MYILRLLCREPVFKDVGAGGPGDEFASETRASVTIASSLMYRQWIVMTIGVDSIDFCCSLRIDARLGASSFVYPLPFARAARSIGMSLMLTFSLASARLFDISSRHAIDFPRRVSFSSVDLAHTRIQFSNPSMNMFRVRLLAMEWWCVLIYEIVVIVSGIWIRVRSVRIQCNTAE